MRDCFFSFPLNEQDSWLFVVEFRGEFYRYGQLAQGSKTSPHACLGFGYAQIELFRDQRGCHQVIEQLPGAKSFDVSVPAVQFVDDNGRIDAISLHMGGDARLDAGLPSLHRRYRHPPPRRTWTTAASGWTRGTRRWK